MSASLIALALAVLQSAAQPATAQTTGGVPLAEACRGRDGWSDPAPPARIAGNTYYVGTCGISAILITSPQGHILLDGGPLNGGPLVAANIERLGFNIRDVRLILASHEHHDHAGGLADLQARSGAQFNARGPGVAAYRTGRPQPGDPQAASLAPFPAVRVSRTLQDGETLRVGDIRVTAHATPGHTPGATSYTWRACAARSCPTIAYVDSLSAISADSYRFSDHPDYVAAFRRGLTRVAALPCDILVTPHPQASNLFPRMAGSDGLANNGCRAYAEGAARRLDRKLADEAAAR